MKTSEERLAELRVLGLLDEEQVIETFMLRLGCSREFAEELFEQFSSEYDPVIVQ